VHSPAAPATATPERRWLQGPAKSAGL
jgi:hypothetical protein